MKLLSEKILMGISFALLCLAVALLMSCGYLSNDPGNINNGMSMDNTGDSNTHMVRPIIIDAPMAAEPTNENFGVTLEFVKRPHSRCILLLQIIPVVT